MEVDDSLWRSLKGKAERERIISQSYTLLEDSLKGNVKKTKNIKKTQFLFLSHGPHCLYLDVGTSKTCPLDDCCMILYIYKKRKRKRVK